ncbi:hypothetical protein [Mycoplasmopsis cynos]|uniref:hypothetical protein n=1 Tax=Mycoplasmopsis cynos TaxID=171284 RepID=UPI0021FE66B9|nr:hypothetical protein [Mycoplasmopsis cynos]UWV92215.1 hypothetical protein NWE57_04890 [Mycoplasmopsis cynos]
MGLPKFNEIVSEYTKKHIEEIKEKIKKSDLKEETKTRLYPYIDEAFDFYQLEIIYNQKIGGMELLEFSIMKNLKKDTIQLNFILLPIYTL